MSNFGVPVKFSFLKFAWVFLSEFSEFGAGKIKNWEQATSHSQLSLKYCISTLYALIFILLPMLSNIYM